MRRVQYFFKKQPTNFQTLQQLRVWTTPSQVNQTKFALDVGNGIITYYEEYYNLGYPLPKQGLCLSVLSLQRYLIIT